MTARTKSMTTGFTPTIAVRYARAIIDLAASRGASRTALMQGASITAAELAEDDNRIAVVKCKALSEVDDRPRVTSGNRRCETGGHAIGTCGHIARFSAS